MYTAMTRWNPSTDLLRDSLSRILDQNFNEFLAPLREGASTRPWMPPVDIRETNDELVFVSELPGLTKDDVAITLEGNVLTIAGERKFERNVDRESYHRIERAYGSFSRSFSLPTNVQNDKVNASFRDGLLTVTVPKQEEAKPRKITIG